VRSRTNWSAGSPDGPIFAVGLRYWGIQKAAAEAAEPAEVGHRRSSAPSAASATDLWTLNRGDAGRPPVGFDGGSGYMYP
jgi:hypothetical protein